MLTNQCLQQTLPDLWKGKFTYKLRQAVTLVTNGSDCWICSQFPTRSDGGIQMMGIPTPNIFSNGIPSAEIMLFLEGKAVQTFTDQQLLTVDLVAMETSCVHRCLKGPGVTPHQKMELPECSLGIMVGIYPRCHSYLDGTGKGILTTHWWPIPDNMGYYWLCGNQARKALSPRWHGICTIGTVVPEIDVIDKSEFPRGHLRSFLTRHKQNVNPFVERSSGFHKFVRGLLLWLGVPELEQAIVNISRVIEQTGNRTNDAISALQQEVTSLSKVVKQNQMALDLLLAAKGGVGTVTNTSCCVYIDQTLRIQTDLEEIRKNTGLLHEIQRDQGTDIFDWITSWILNLSAITRKLTGVIIVVLTLMFGRWIIFQNCQTGTNNMCKSSNNHFL